jgi:formiminotetrahydrofolate cyclodeaminase
MDTQKTIQQYLDELSSNSPTPGGGNVSAFSGALAASLGIMVCNLTIGKKKYADVETEVAQLKESLLSLQSEFLVDAHRDNEAFNRVMAAFKLPKETPEEQKIRKSAIDLATFEAAKVPFLVMEKCSTTMPLLCKLAKIGNQNSLSDAATGCHLLRAAANGAFMNVLINCASLSESPEAAQLLADAERCLSLIEDNARIVIQSMTTKLRQG